MGSSFSSLLEIPLPPSSSSDEHSHAPRQGAPPPPPAPTSAAASASASASGTEEKKQQREPPPPSTTTTTKSEWVPPHNFSEIVGQDKAVEDERRLRAQVSQGIYLDGNKKKYWVDERTKANCFMLFARGLSITWGSDQRYWGWRKLDQKERTPETADTETDIEVAYLKDVCWLEIQGWLEMSHLSPGCTYDVFFVAKLTPNAYGWSVPVDLHLKFPDGTLPQQKGSKEHLRSMGAKKDEWAQVKVGEVAVAAGHKGQMEIAMLRLGGEWKRGLVLLGIKITPHLHQ